MEKLRRLQELKVLLQQVGQSQDTSSMFTLKVAIKTLIRQGYSMEGYSSILPALILLLRRIELDFAVRKSGDMNETERVQTRLNVERLFAFVSNTAPFSIKTSI